MKYRVTPKHIFVSDNSIENDIFEISIRRRWELEIQIVQTEEAYFSLLEENKGLYDSETRRYHPIKPYGVYAYDLLYSQKHKNQLPFPHHRGRELIGQQLSKQITTLVKNGMVKTILFPSDNQQKKHLAEELIYNEILSIQDIALFGVSEDNTECTLYLELHPFRTDDFVLLGR